ncbi:MT-A70 family methyltransferase [Pseudarthrobacter oxydans]|uniref:MT-A70 family methyltransferase n=1 Tax=Pseudarthrobacter oxydans TaxID=1671 RepID=UPI0035E7AC85|nr:MT-A70 family methyltransferase [Pseudarthrobacter oxydans]
MKRYTTILADPPWAMNQIGSRGAVRHYPVMSLDDIKGLPVHRLAADNAHLWLWVTNADIFRQIEVMETWGFTYKSCLTWIKPYYGLGGYLRNQTEHLLLGVKGRLPVQFRGQGSWTFAPLQGHSHKPEEQYAIIERCSPGPYLELFARRPQPGWESWGNEMDGRDLRLVLNSEPEAEAA